MHTGFKLSVTESNYPSYSVSGFYEVTETKFSLTPEINKKLPKFFNQWFVRKGISGNEGHWLLRGRKLMTYVP